MGNATGPLLDSIQILWNSVPSIHRPSRSAKQHRVNFIIIQSDRSGSTNSGRDLARQGIGKPLLPQLDCLHVETCQQRAYSA